MRILRKIRSLLRKIRSLLRKFRIRQIRFGMAPATNKRQCRSVRAETPRTKKVWFVRVRCLHGMLHGGLLDGLLHGGLLDGLGGLSIFPNKITVAIANQNQAKPFLTYFICIDVCFIT